MAYKILFTGTTSSGKSTLLNHLKSSKKPNVLFIPEIAREILSKSLELEKDPRLQDIIFAEQIRREREGEAQGYHVLICDRGSLDIIAYSRMFGHTIKPEWEEWTKTYTEILVFNHKDIPLNTTLYPPGRDWSEFRDSLAGHIEAVLKDYSLPFRLVSGMVEQRVEILNSIIGGVIEGHRLGKER